MIIYFSGSGNSLSISRGLAELLGDEAVHMNDAMKKGSEPNDLIGLVYPCYYNDMPNAVKDFVKSYSFKNADHIFGIVVHGGDPGNSLFTLQELLKEKGSDLSYGQDVLMPVNSRIMYGRTTTDIDTRVSEEKVTVKRIAIDIMNRKKDVDKVKKRLVATIMSNLSNSGLVKVLMKKKVDNERCINCGICERVCSLNNIKVTENEVMIGDNCTDCLACMHWCPKAAIGFGNRKVRKEQQYHHPDVSLNDMILEK